MEEKKKRHRRTAEERLADLERQRAELLERQKAMLAKIDEQKAKITKSPTSRKTDLENQKRFERAAKKLAPDWDHRHFIVLIQEAVERGMDADAVTERGQALLEEHGKPRRGRRLKSA